MNSILPRSLPSHGRQESTTSALAIIRPGQSDLSTTSPILINASQTARRPVQEPVARSGQQRCSVLLPVLRHLATHPHHASEPSLGRKPARLLDIQSVTRNLVGGPRISPCTASSAGTVRCIEPGERRGGGASQSQPAATGLAGTGNGDSSYPRCWYARLITPFFRPNVSNYSRMI